MTIPVCFSRRRRRRRRDARRHIEITREMIDRHLLLSQTQTSDECPSYACVGSLVVGGVGARPRAIGVRSALETSRRGSSGFARVRGARRRREKELGIWRLRVRRIPSKPRGGACTRPTGIRSRALISTPRGRRASPRTRTSARPTGSRARAAARARSLFENEDRTRGDRTTARALDPAQLARGTRAHSPRTHVRGDDGQYAAPGRRRHAAARVEGARRRRRRRLLSVNNMKEATDASARFATRATTTSLPRTSTRSHLSNRHPHARWFAAGTR